MFQTWVASRLTHRIAECSHTSEGKFAGVQGQGESWQSFNQASVVVHAHARKYVSIKALILSYLQECMVTCCKFLSG